jgi:hypothetical protein
VSFLRTRTHNAVVLCRLVAFLSRSQRHFLWRVRVCVAASDSAVVVARVHMVPRGNGPVWRYHRYHFISPSGRGRHQSLTRSGDSQILGIVIKDYHYYHYFIIIVAALSLCNIFILFYCCKWAPTFHYYYYYYYYYHYYIYNCEIQFTLFFVYIKPIGVLYL